MNKVIEDIKGLAYIVPLKPFRKTKGVRFDMLSLSSLPKVECVDRVIHEKGALSPGAVAGVDRPWYMHQYQQDYLMVLSGVRYTELYTPSHGKVEHYEVAPEYIKKNGGIIHEGPAILSWPCIVFHRIISCDKTGSASINFACRYEGFNMDNNFSIYDVDTNTGIFEIIREGFLDQERI